MPQAPRDPIDQHLGRRIRQRRLDLGLSQRALGDRVGVTFQQIQKYEHGAGRLAAARLANLAHALGDTPIGWFFDGNPDRAASAPADDRMARLYDSRDGQALMSAAAALPPARLRALLRVAQALADEANGDMPPEEMSR